MIMPPQPGSALLPEAMRAGLVKLLRAGGQSPLLQYQPSGGALRDRQEAARAFGARGLATGEDQAIITAGGQNALHAILGTVFSPGDIICAGASTYPGLLALARRFGLTVRAVPGDRGGLDPDAIQAAALAGAKAVYVVPTNDNPTTATLDLERRLWLAAIARRHGLILIEDDAYGQLPAKPLPPLAALAPELSWHIASASKIISPVLRVAHLRAPSAAMARRLAADIHETAIMAPPLNAALVTLWLRDGLFAELVGKVRAEGIARQRIAARFLAGADHDAHPEGYHIWLRLPAGGDAADLAAHVRPAGLSIVPGSTFAVDPAHAEAAVRISIGGSIDHVRLGQAFALLAARMR
jgi:DNA-binding transcriptional MocR family regulator